MNFDPIRFRHQLHSMPELAHEEHTTKKLILNALIASMTTNGAGQLFHIVPSRVSRGLFIIYTNAVDEPYQLFRADMDALPITEENDIPYKSLSQNKMHACGHDVHMSVLMGLIDRVAKEQPKKNLIFVFQPAEEGAGGAEMMIAEGVLQEYPISAAFALHTGSGYEVGQISSKAGSFFAIPQEFDLIFSGLTSHAAFPEKGVNALSAAVDFLQDIKGDLEDLMAEERIIFHIGKFISGEVRNAVAGKAVLEGTHRTLSKEMKKRLNELIERKAKEAAERYGATVELKLLGSYDPVINDEKLYKRLKELSAKLNLDFVEAEQVMTGEDFGFFSSIYPSLLFWLGSGCAQPLHSPKYLPKDESIAIGIEVFWALATE